MKKTLIIIALLAISCGLAGAQDLITKNDGTDIKAKVLEVSPTEVRYKMWDNQEGPVFVLNAADILLIRFENGENYVIEKKEAAKADDHPLFFTSDVSILEQSGLKYEQLKEVYNSDDYDQLYRPRYKLGYPWLNLLLPGLAQYCMSEPGLGTRFVLIYLGGGILSNIGSSMSGSYTTDGHYVRSPSYGVGTALALTGCAIFVGTEIWSIINAYDVAKVKSLYVEDIRNYNRSYSFTLAPTVVYSTTPAGIRPAPGIGLRVTF